MLHHDAGYPRGKDVRQGANRGGLSECGDRDILHGIANLDATLLPGSSGDDFLKLYGRRRHHEVKRRCLTVEDLDGLLLLLVTDAVHANLRGSGGDAAEDVLAVRPGRGEHARSHGDHSRLLQWHAGLRRDRASDGTLRRGKSGGHREQRNG